MFYFRSKQERPTALTTEPAQPTDEAAQRTARHLSMCQRLAELGMALAEAAAERALQSRPEPEPDAQPRANGADPNLVFARLSHSVRQSIALEARIVAGNFAGPTRRPTPRTLADPRREPIRQALHEAVARAPDRVAFRREIDERLDFELANDPEQLLKSTDLLDTLCEAMQIELDFSKMSNEFLDLLDPSPW